MELHNSYTSSSSSRGINAGATIGYGHKLQTTGITPSNLDITYRTGSIISKTIIKVSKNIDNSITIVLIRWHKLYDAFSKPFDLKNGFPDK